MPKCGATVRVERNYSNQLRTLQSLHQLINFSVYVAFVDQSLTDTLADVGAHNLVFDRGQGRSRGFDLIEDINAVLALLNHCDDAVDLARCAL